VCVGATSTFQQLTRFVMLTASDGVHGSLLHAVKQNTVHAAGMLQELVQTQAI
jgi:hypothetical protein